MRYKGHYLYAKAAVCRVVGHSGDNLYIVDITYTFGLPADGKQAIPTQKEGLSK